MPKWSTIINVGAGVVMGLAIVFLLFTGVIQNNEIKAMELTVAAQQEEIADLKRRLAPVTDTYDGWKRQVKTNTSDIEDLREEVADSSGALYSHESRDHAILNGWVQDNRVNIRELQATMRGILSK